MGIMRGSAPVWNPTVGKWLHFRLIDQQERDRHRHRAARGHAEIGVLWEWAERYGFERGTVGESPNAVRYRLRRDCDGTLIVAEWTPLLGRLFAVVVRDRRRRVDLKTKAHTAAEAAGFLEWELCNWL